MKNKLKRSQLRRLLLQEYKRLLREEEIGGSSEAFSDIEEMGVSDQNRHAEVMAKLEEILARLPDPSGI